MLVLLLNTPAHTSHIYTLYSFSLADEQIQHSLLLAVRLPVLDSSHQLVHDFRAPLFGFWDTNDPCMWAQSCRPCSKPKKRQLSATCGSRVVVIIHTCSFVTFEEIKGIICGIFSQHSPVHAQYSWVVHIGVNHTDLPKPVHLNWYFFKFYIMITPSHNTGEQYEKKWFG